MKDRAALLDVSELYRPELIKGKDHKFRRYTFDVRRFLYLFKKKEQTNDDHSSNYVLYHLIG